MPKKKNINLEKHEVLGFVLEDGNKFQRAVYGSAGKDGLLVGGVGEDARPEVILGAYDRLAGYITKNGRKVKNGGFCDYNESKKQGRLILRDNPEIILQVRGADGQLYEVEEGGELPLEVQVVDFKEEKREEFQKQQDKERSAAESEIKRVRKVKK